MWPRSWRVIRTLPWPAQGQNRANANTQPGQVGSSELPGSVMVGALEEGDALSLQFLGKACMVDVVVSGECVAEIV